MTSDEVSSSTIEYNIIVPLFTRLVIYHACFDAKVVHVLTTDRQTKPIALPLAVHACAG